MKENVFKKIIYSLSIVIPLVVVFLFRIKIEGYDTTFLPAIYATTNGITAILLISALWAIKNKNVKLHESLVTICLVLSLLFLILYVIRHITSSEVVFGDLNRDGILSSDERSLIGWERYVYYFILITHISLSVIVIPLVLFSYMRGKLGQIDLHKKIVKWSFPVWLYVSITGVLVYVMISNYY
jgi:putative membrane protein